MALRVEGLMSRFCLAGFAVVFWILTAALTPASASTITETYDFIASGFTTSPVDPWQGTFTITFDPTASGSFGPLPLDAFSSNLSASYDPFVFSQAGNFISIGDNCGAGGSCVAASNEAFFNFHVDSFGNPTAGQASISAEIGSSLSVTLESTPLPAALPMFLGGAGLIGLLARRKKQRQPA